MKKFTCGICGKQCSNRGKASLKYHVEHIHNMLYSDYMRMVYPDQGLCLVCGKPTKLIKGIFKKTCSKECENILHSKQMLSGLTEESKVKRMETNKVRYGGNTPANSPETIHKMKITCMEKYGVDSYSKTENFKDNVKIKLQPFRFSQHLYMMDRFGIECLESEMEWMEKEKKMTKTIPYSWCSNNTHKMKCKIHGNFEDFFISYGSNICPKCRKALWSQGEREVGDYIESLGIFIIRNDRNMIKPKEIDIWIPSKNIGIEYNGEYWHKDIERDLEKKLLCESKGIRLFTIWDTEWNKNKEEVKEYLRRLLND